MKVKDKDDFMKYKNKLTEERKKSGKIRVLVGLGTCGIAAGAKEVFSDIKEAVERRNLTNTEIIPVGCVGYCYAEPTVEIVYDDNDEKDSSVLLGNINSNNVDDIVELHIKNKNLDSKHVIKTNIAKNVFAGGDK